MKTLYKDSLSTKICCHVVNGLNRNIIWSYDRNFLDETSGVTGGEGSHLEPVPVPVSLPPVSAEQLFPAGKILQMEERPSCR